MNFFRDWNEFWFRPRNCAQLGIFRITLGVLILIKLILLLPVMNDCFTEGGLIPLASSIHSSPLPRICIFDFIPDQLLGLLFALMIAVAFFFMMGLSTRLMTLLLFIAMISIDTRNVWIINSGDRLLSILLFYGIFAPLGKTYSLDHYLDVLKGRQRAGPVYGSLWAARLMQVQVCMMYFWSAYIKVHSNLWEHGQAMYFITRNVERARFAIPWLPNHFWTINLLTYFTIFLEGFFPFAVWSRRTRGYILLVGLMLHLGIEWAMTIQIFGYIVISTYILFFDGEEIENFMSRARELLTLRTVPVFYDGNCGLCQETVKIVSGWDKFRSFIFFNFRDPALQREHPDLDLVRAEKEMLLKAGIHWYGGFHAFRWMAWRMPLFWLLVPFLYLPGVPAIGSWVYRWVAFRRLSFGSCPTHLSQA